MTKTLVSAASLGLVAISGIPGHACSTHALTAASAGTPSAPGISFPVPIRVDVRHRADNPGSGVARVATFRVEATAGDTCAVAVALSRKLEIRSITFIREDETPLAFATFAPDRALARSFDHDRGDPPFRVFTAEVRADIAATIARLDITFEARRRGLPEQARPSISDMFARSRIALSKVESGPSLGHHLSVLRPVLALGCLGARAADGLTACPREAGRGTP